MASFEIDVIIKTLTVAGPAVLVLAPLLAIRSILYAASRPIQGICVPVICAALLGSFFNYLPPLLEDVMNHARLPVNSVYYRYAEAFPKRFDVADLHCDALLWGTRDLLRTTKHPLYTDRPVGHVDIPRLVAGNVKIQVFAAVNSAPRKLNFETNLPPSRFSDSLFLKSVVERWPSRTWFSPKERVLYQFDRLRNMCKRSNGVLEVAQSSRDMAAPSSQVLAVLAVEGLSCLESNLLTVDEFFDAGIRMLGPTHFFDTEVGGSLSGTCNCGLTEFGRGVLHRMKALRMIVDLAHASVPLMADILDLDDNERPALMISHTGLQSVCSSQRNLADEYMKRISRSGGLIGITLFEPALCGGDIIGSFVKSVSHAASVLGGVDSIALGSDWDGVVLTSVSPADSHLLSSALLAIGNFSEADVRKIMFENVNDFFSTHLPL